MVVSKETLETNLNLPNPWYISVNRRKFLRQAMYRVFEDSVYEL